MSELPTITRILRCERPATAPQAFDVEVEADNGQHWFLRFSDEAAAALAKALAGPG